MFSNLQPDLARVQLAARLGEAQSLRRGRSVVVGRRLARRAARAEQQASLALARL